MARYSKPYDPAFRLVTTEPRSSKVVKVGGFEVPTEFICNLFVVDDEGKAVDRGKVNDYPTFSISMIIKVLPSGKPVLVNVEVRGATDRRSAPMGNGFRTVLFDDSKPLTPWQLKFVDRYRGTLIRRAVYEVANSWTLRKEGTKVSWNFPITNVKKISDADKLEREVDRRLRERHDFYYFEELAQRFLEAESSGLDPILELMKEFPGGHRTIQRHVAECRRLKLLPKGKPGRPSKRRHENKQGKEKHGNTKKAKSR